MSERETGWHTAVAYVTAEARYGRAGGHRVVTDLKVVALHQSYKKPGPGQVCFRLAARLPDAAFVSYVPQAEVTVGEDALVLGEPLAAEASRP